MGTLRLLAFSVTLILLASGCLSLAPRPLNVVEPVGAAFTMDLPIHVVAVGFENFNEGQLVSKLRQPIAPYKLIRWGTTGDERSEPLQYRLQYQVHEASDAFAQDLFAYAASTASNGPPDAFLSAYDRAGPKRVCPAAGPGVTLVAGITPRVPPAAPCKDIQRIDAVKLETWIADHRSDYGLDWPAPGYTVFILDSYTKGLLPKDSYHVYAIDDGTSLSRVKNQRGWGGAHDFVFWDVGAAPNGADFMPWANYTNEGNKLSGKEDRPIWDYDLAKHGTAQTGSSPALLGSKDRDATTFYANVAQNVYDAARLLWARSPIYPFEYYETYDLPMYIIIDPNAHTNPESPLARFKPADVEKNTDVAGIRRAFEDLVPWAQVNLDVKFIYLPEGDAALAEALQDAKTRYASGQVDFGILKKYFREHWDEYVPQADGARSYPTFAFWLEAPSTGIYAYSDGDELGNSWGVFYNAADTALCIRPNVPLCFTEELFGNDATWWRIWNGILIHELGHSFGLTHPHDTGGYDEKHFFTYEVNWLWDSTSSVMTYRHSLPAFNQFDRDLILRGNAVEIAFDLTDEAARTQVLQRVRAGDYAGAFALARERAIAEGLVAAPEDLGTRGEPKSWRLEVPAGSEPAGGLPVWSPFLSAVPGLDALAYAEFPVNFDAGVHAVEIEYREAEARSHAKWSAIVVIVNKDGDAVTFLGNNGYDKMVYMNEQRCRGGCTGLLYSFSGAAMTYDVTVTPFT